MSFICALVPVSSDHVSDIMYLTLVPLEVKKTKPPRNSSLVLEMEDIIRKAYLWALRIDEQGQYTEPYGS